MPLLVRTGGKRKEVVERRVFLLLLMLMLLLLLLRMKIRFRRRSDEGVVVLLFVMLMVVGEEMGIIQLEFLVHRLAGQEGRRTILVFDRGDARWWRLFVDHET